MTKTRSPGYPAIGLGEAIDKVRLVWEQDYQNEIPKIVVAQHMGYKGLSGTSLTILAALTKYGFLEGRGDNTRVTDRALTILAHDPGNKERVAALSEAAESPDLFSELDARFNGGKTSDNALRSYLLTKKFIPSATDGIIRSYRQTKQLIEEESKGYNDTSDAPEEPLMLEPAQRDRGQAPKPYLDFERETTGEPFRVSFGAKGMEITGLILTSKDADELIRAIQALKILLRPTEGIREQNALEASETETAS